MIRTATAKTIASATGISAQAVSKNLKKGHYPSIWKKGQGGHEKRYLVGLLPEKYRVALAAKYAEPEGGADGCEETRIGAAAAREIMALRAEEKEKRQIAQEDALAAFERLPEKRKEEALARFALLRRCDGFVKAAGFTMRRYARRSKVGDQAFVQAYNDGRIEVSEVIRAVIGEKTSYSTLKRIADAHYRYGVVGLAFGYHNPKRGSTALTDEQQDLVIRVMCRNPQTSAVNIRKALQGEFGREVPSVNVIQRFRNQWIENNNELWLYYANPDEWKSKRMFAYGSASDHIERLNQLWEADSTPADLMLSDGRHSLVGMIDVCSRRLRLVVSKTSKATAVVVLIRHCIIDWGVPEIIKTDNGKDYRSDHVVRVLHGLDVEQRFCTPFQGQEKPHIERAFRTFLHGMVELMPGYIGHNVTERKAIEARRSFADRVMNKENETVGVNISSAELQKFCNEWTNFVYHHDRHSGLDGKKPMEVVRAWRGPLRRITDFRALDMLLLPAPKDGGIRIIRKKGVLVENRYFQSPDFAGNVGSKVFVLLDPVDMGTAYIYLLEKDGGKSFLCAAIDPKWSGIDVAKFATSALKHQKKVMNEGRRELKKRSKAEGERHAYEKYVDFRKRETGKLMEFPQQAIPYTTPDLEEAGRAARAQDSVQEEQQALNNSLNHNEILLSDPEKPKAAEVESKVISIITCDSDRYLDIRSKVHLEKRKLTKWEHSWLAYFYTKTDIGRSYLMLEGDMREEIGLEEQSRAQR